MGLLPKPNPERFTEPLLKRLLPLLSPAWPRRLSPERITEPLLKRLLPLLSPASPR